jgi:NAD(P)-dependent dehydrogenase (short-subunit alcohol dehydrogenase family)
VTDISFSGQTVLISGAGRGLGEAYARFLADRGATVAVNDIDADAAESVARAIGGHSVPGDVSTETGATDVVERALGLCGRCDAIVANAGTSWPQMFADLSVAEIESALRDNLLSTVHFLRAMWPHFLQQRYGRIVTTASSAVFGVNERAHYIAAKGGVLALSRALANEGHRDGIAVNCVLPRAQTRLTPVDRSSPAPATNAATVAWLCHPACEITGEAFAIGGDTLARVIFRSGDPIPVDPLRVDAQRDAMSAMVLADSPA